MYVCSSVEHDTGNIFPLPSRKNPLNSCVVTRSLAQRAPWPSVCHSLTVPCQGLCMSVLPRRATRRESGNGKSEHEEDKARAKRRQSILKIEPGIFRVRQVGWRAKERERVVGV